MSTLILVIYAAFASTCSMIALSHGDESVTEQNFNGRVEKELAAVSDPEAGGSSAAIGELNDRLVALPPGSPLEFSAEVFSTLNDTLATARVVGLGEATHGTAEFFELKHRLFKHLVEAHGHRALGYEVSFAASLALDRFVATGEGSLDELLGDLLFIQANEEVRALLEWMREHNRGLPEDERVRFIGIDSQLDMWNLRLHRKIFRARFPLVYRDLQTRFDALEELGRIDYRAITRDEVDRIRSVLGTMADFVEVSAQGMSQSDASIAAHLIEALQRSHEFLFSAYQGSNDIRDGHLAANALWIGGFLGDGVPYSVWAHNSHVGADPYSYGENGPGSMGFDLTRQLGAAYFRIATAFSRGSFVAVRGDWRGRDTTPMFCRLDSDPPADSINAILDRAAADRYLLNLRSIPDGSALDRFLDAERPMLGVGDFFADDIDVHYHSPDRLVRIFDAYDAVFYFSETEGVHPLESTNAP